MTNDGAARRFLIRDADSIVNSREQAAVTAWLALDRALHVMRDNWAHTELVLAGMWGGVDGILPRVTGPPENFTGESPLNRRADQRFLRDRVWPTIRQSVLTHDRHYRVLDAVDFPEGSDLPGGRHVAECGKKWRPQGDSNPRFRRERPMS